MSVLPDPCVEYTEDRKIALFDHMAKEPFHLPVKPVASDGMEVYAVDLFRWSSELHVLSCLNK